MSNQYRLVGLGNSELLAGLSALVRQSNVLTGRLLAHLVELEERKLQLELGFPSLFNAVPVPAVPVAPRPRGRDLEPLSAARFGVHFTADAELRELIERARALASHQLPNGDLAGLIKLMAASFVRQEENWRFGIGARPRRAKLETATPRSAEPKAPPGEVSVSAAASEPTAHEAGAVPAGERGRYVAAAVRREIHDRDGGQCAFVSADGRRCNARAFLEFDHVKPYARSGAPDALNLRLLCKAHNLLHARTCFGAMHVAAKIATRRLRDQAIHTRR